MWVGRARKTGFFFFVALEYESVDSFWRMWNVQSMDG